MNLAILLLNLLPTLLQSIPGISSAIKQVVADVSGSASVVLSSGVVTGPSANTVMAAWLGVINVLKADPNIPAATLNAVLNLEKAVQAALTQDVQAQAQVDWSKIITISKV